MNLTITGRHMDLTDALKAYVDNGLRKLRTHFDKMIDVIVVLSVEKHRQQCEINLHANGVRIHARESTADMYASVDACLTKLDKQIRKFKDRINRHQPRTARETRNYHIGVIEMIEQELGGDGAVQVLAPAHRMVQREKIEMKPMSVEEATMQLDLVDEDFLVFYNADSQQVNVIYSRGEGTYGLIEPQF